MRWDGLFADLEAQAAALEQAERAAEVESAPAARSARLHCSTGCAPRWARRCALRLSAGTRVSGVLRRVGPDWLLLDEGAGREAVVAARGVRQRARAGPVLGRARSAGVVESRLGLRHALRGIARDRSTGAHAPASERPVDTSTRRSTGSAPTSSRSRRTRPARPGAGAEVREIELRAVRALVAVRRDGAERQSASVGALGLDERVLVDERRWSARTSARCRPRAGRARPATGRGRRS